MLSKEEFVKYLDNWNIFWDIITEDIITDDDVFVSTVAPVSKMLETFLNSHFTEEGTKFILEWLDNNKSTTLTYSGLFDKNEEYIIDNIDKLWNYVKIYLLHG